MNYLMIEKFSTPHSRSRRNYRKHALLIVLLVVPLIIVVAAWMVLGPFELGAIQAATERLALGT